jgi:hypothetical protein
VIGTNVVFKGLANRGTHASGGASANRVHHYHADAGPLNELIDGTGSAQLFDSQASKFFTHGNNHDLWIHIGLNPPAPTRWGGTSQCLSVKTVRY